MAIQPDLLAFSGGGHFFCKVGFRLFDTFAKVKADKATDLDDFPQNAELLYDQLMDRKK